MGDGGACCVVVCLENVGFARKCALCNVLGNRHATKALRQSVAARGLAQLEGSVGSVSGGHVQLLEFGCVYSAVL